MRTIHLFKMQDPTGSWLMWCGKWPPGVKQPDDSYLYDPWAVAPEIVTCSKCLEAWSAATFVPPPPEPPSRRQRLKMLARFTLHQVLSTLHQLEQRL